METKEGSEIKLEEAVNGKQKGGNKNDVDNSERQTDEVGKVESGDKTEKDETGEKVKIWRKLRMLTVRCKTAEENVVLVIVQVTTVSRHREVVKCAVEAMHPLKDLIQVKRSRKFQKIVLKEYLGIAKKECVKSI